MQPLMLLMSCTMVKICKISGTRKLGSKLAPIFYTVYVHIHDVHPTDWLSHHMIFVFFHFNCYFYFLILWFELN